MALNASDIRRNGYHVPGFGYFQNEPLVTVDDDGNRHVGGGVIYEGHVNEDGGLDTDSFDRLAKAYDWIKADTSSALKRWKKSRSGSDEEERSLEDLYKLYVSNGRYSGTFADFPAWFDRYMAQMEAETLPVSALYSMTGTPGKTQAEKNYKKNTANYASGQQTTRQGGNIYTNQGNGTWTSKNGGWITDANLR